MLQIADDTPKQHKFWSTQPVPQSPDDRDKDGPLEPNREPEAMRQTPYNLPAGFEWVEVDVNKEEELEEVYKLLLENYVEDQEAQFRFGYPKELLSWALKPPGWKMNWHIGVRVSTTRRLVAFISGVPASISVNKTALPMVEINFLCVLKKLRSKRMAPVLIKEITRRCNLEGIFQALYTAGVELPGAVSKSRYYHRSINYPKLVDVGFSAPPQNMTLDERVKQLALSPDLVPGIRPMTSADVPAVTAGLSAFFSRFNLHPNFSEDEVEHWFVPKDNVVYSYVAASGVSGDSDEIDCFVSFYRIPSKVLNHPTHKEINAAYAFYYFYPYQEDAAAKNKRMLTRLMNSALVFAKQTDHDVFNCLALMDNPSVLKELQFGKGDGVLHYYLYNWRCKEMDGREVASVLM
ncbi:Myristoyl-CoA:protein N-myristoyltransferase, N-terminal domain-domain-containing protein [Catenaria anguillulae PL171]|uniref:Glycylpeptide N-tetradecanoyltransferase n=1 Tax=Catenaria anguillulae PL171 TaxID=765915 RepID=A0A1Y2HRL4_9FUNG|nr:Myristoyl-CoA:protein N-myristoyltransferase, N-terminal domain-domain-containing protein [Catenaria anguillulae PL171]